MKITIEHLKYNFSLELQRTFLEATLVKASHPVTADLKHK